MTGVFFGPVGIDLAPLVEEAISALGYFEPSAGTELTALFEQQWPHGTSKTMLIYGDGLGDNLDGMEREVAGIGKMRMPKAIWGILSAAGRADPYAAIEATTLRVIFGVRRKRFEARAGSWGKPNMMVRLWARNGFVCRAMQGRDQAIFPWRASPLLPQPSCDREYCTCYFTVEFEDDLGG